MESLRRGNLILVGTSHIAKQSVDKVRKLIKEEDPDIVALELDARRFYALTHKDQKRGFPNPFRVGFKGLIFSLFGAWAERRLGDYVGVSPGTEMVTAGQLAKDLKKKLVFIDQDIEITLKRLSTELTWKEKGRFVSDIVKSIFTTKDSIKIDLTKVPSKKVIEELLRHVRERYPNIHKVLVDERNMIMAMRLKHLMRHYPEKSILAIVGAGHVEEISAMLDDEPEISYEFSYSA